MTLKKNRSPLLSNTKLFASFHHHMWIQTGVTVRKQLSLVLTSVTLTFDLWPWLFAWTSRLSMVITPEISWWYDDRNIVKRVSQTDGRTGRCSPRAAWSQLKILRPKQNVCSYGDIIKCIYLKERWFHLDSNSAEVCSYESNWQEVNVCWDNGLVTNKRQAITLVTS